MRSLLRLVLLLAVLGTAGWFLTRWAVGSSWGHEVVERRIGRALDMDAAVARVRLEWPGVVVAEEVTARISADGAGTPELTVLELRRSLCGRRTELRRPQVRLTQGPAGDWQPAALRALARGVDAAVPVEEVLDRTARVLAAGQSFDVANASILCRAADGTEQPVFGGLSWRTRRVVLDGHGRVTHHHATLQTRCGKPVGTDGLLTVEWLSERGCVPLRLWGAEAADAAPSGPEPGLEATRGAAPSTPPAATATPVDEAPAKVVAETSEAESPTAPAAEGAL